MKNIKCLFMILIFSIISFVTSAATNVTVKVDMSILWGSELPDTVYMFAYLNSNQGMNGVFYKKVPNLSIQSDYNSSLKGSNTDQNTAGALALTDSDKDGIYEGTFSYSGTVDTAFHTRLFISKSDANNVVHTPKYEEGVGPYGADVDVNDFIDFRTITIKSNGTVWIGWDASGLTGMNPKVEATGNIIETSWEKKSINTVQLGYYNSNGTLEFSNIDTQIDIYQGLSRDIKVYAGYSNANSTLRQEITKYITYETTVANSNYISVTKEKSGEIVTGVAVYGKLYSNGTVIPVALKRNGKSLPGNGLKINIKAISSTSAYQTIFVQPLNSVVSGSDYVVSGVSDYDGKVLKGANLTSLKDGIYFTGNIFSYSNFENQGTDIWRAAAAKNIVVIPKTKENLSATKEVTLKKSGETTGSVVTIPASLKSFTYTKGNGTALFTWREADNSTAAKAITDKYNSVYNKQEIIIRISKIETEPQSWKLDPYNMLNPVILGYGITGPEAMKNFYNNTNKYVDFVFNAQVEETRVTYDGAEISYKYNSIDRTISIRGVAEDKYKVQLYTVKYASGFAVLTFEQESSFEISAIATDESTAEKGYFLITGVDSSKFGTISVGVMTKTPDDIELKKENVYFGGVAALVGESRKKKEEADFDSPIQTNDPISVVEDVDSKIPKHPLDVILVLDGGSSMAGKMEAIKTAWREIEVELSTRGYDVKYRVVKFGEDSYTHLWTQSGWNTTIDDIYFKTGSGAAVNGKKKSDVAINSALATFESEGRYLGINSSGEWEINTSKNGTPSTRWLVFMTDTNASNEITPDVLSTKIRMSGVIFTGIGGVKKDGLMYADDYVSPTGERYEAFYPENKNADNEQHYYHLRLIMGYKFKFYQISNQSTQIYNQLSDSIKAISITKRWKIIYNTPRTVRDGSQRRAMFDIYLNSNELIYQGTLTDREYIAPELAMTTDSPDQVVIAYFSAGKIFAGGMYNITDKFALGNSYRAMKTANITDMEDAVYNFYNDAKSFSIDGKNIDDNGLNYGDRWSLDADATANAVLIKKVPGNGVGAVGETTGNNFFSFGYNERIKSLKANSLGDKATITWSEENSNPNATFSASKYMLRIVKAVNKGETYRYNLYDKLNGINYMDFETAAIVNEEPGTVADEKMDSFLGGKGDNYIDYIFDKTVAMSTTALGARVDYGVNGVNVLGLTPDNYAIQIYTIKEGFSAIDNTPYKVITYNGEIEFKIDQPQIAVKPSGANGIFTVDYIDVTKFNQITTHFSTKMPFSIEMPKAENIFLNKEEMTKTGEVTRVTETRYETNQPETKIVDSGIVIEPSDLRKFKQPLDIVFCIDNSGSMQNEIDAVKNGLKSFSSTLTKRGFDIKYKVINYGPDQGEITYQYKYTGVNSESVTYPNGTENGIKVYTDEGSGVKYYYYGYINNQYRYIAVSGTAGQMPFGAALTRGQYPNRSIKISATTAYLENKTDGVRHEIWSSVNLGNTVGSYITATKVYTGKADGSFPEVTMVREENSNNYMTVYKDKWFDGDYATNLNPTDEEADILSTDDAATRVSKIQKYKELSEVVYAFDGMVANGGYRNGQENGARAIHHAQEFLKNNGRVVDYIGNIIESSEVTAATKISLKSTKWIIFLTDENMDYSTPGNGYTSDGSSSNVTGVHNITKELADNMSAENIFLTGIFHIRNTNYPIPVDKRGVSGVYPADTGDVYYNEFAYMGDYFNMYEMGASGEETEAALLDSVNNIGIIQRWMMTYNSPFNVPDGTERTVNFILGNLKAASATDTRTPEDANTETVTTETGNTVVQARLYKAPDIAVDVTIESPLNDGVFTYNSENSNYIIVKGKARGIERNSEDEDANDNYAVMKEAKISIYVHGSATPIAGLENISYVFDEDEDNLSDGYYKFEVKDIPQSLLEGTGAEKFDVKVTATTEKGGDGQDIVKNVGLDSGAPKLVSVSMVNSTSVDELSSMKLSDGTGDLFTVEEAIALSTMSYIPFEINPELSYKYSFTTGRNLNFADRINKTTLDGRFVKINDEIEIKAVFIDENFDSINANTADDFNVIRAKFESLTDNPVYIAPTEVKYDTTYKIGTTAGVKITAVWKVKVLKSENFNATINLKAIDAIGNSSEDLVKNIDIAVVDNTKPFNPSWNTISASKDTLGAEPTALNMLSFVNGGWITNGRYQLNCKSDEFIDTNGIRAYRVYYNYDHTQSDLGAANRGGTGNHDADKDDGGAKYFYVKAGNGINLGNNDTILPTSGIGIKNIEAGNHYDDGKYIYKILAVDKAGNTTEISNSVAEQIVYVDTIAPRVKGEVLKKIADANGFVPKDSDGNEIPYADNLIKNGDTARIEYSTMDFNLSTNKADYLKEDIYPVYSWMINGNQETPDIVLGEKKTFDLGGIFYSVLVSVGDKSFKDVSKGTPNILVSGLSVGTEEYRQAYVFARDLAGNEVPSDNSSSSSTGNNNSSDDDDDQKIDIKVDTKTPAAVEVYAYAYEKITSNVIYSADISESIKAIYDKTPGNGVIHITRGGDGKISGKDREFYIKLRGSGNSVLPDDAVYYTVSLNEKESSKKDLTIETGEIIFSKTYNTIDFIPIDGVNKVTARVSDLAGNQSETSTVKGVITLDKMIGKPSTAVNLQGKTANLKNSQYEFKLDGIKIPEFAGIKEVTAVKVENGTVVKQITGIEPKKINYLPNPLGGEIEIAGSSLFIPKANVPEIIKGTRAIVTLRFTDNLGNQKDFRVSYLIPKEGLEVKSQQNGAEKETRTKVKVVGENEFELQRVEEGGKTK